MCLNTHYKPEKCLLKIFNCKGGFTMNGYVKIHRDLCNHSIWLAEKFTRGQAWVDLILLANAKEGFVIKRGIRIHLDKGQVGWAIITLAERWKWGEGKVKRFLKLLASEGMVELNITNVSCTTTILNYDYWQSNSDWQVRRDDEYSKEKQQTESKRRTSRNQTKTKRNTNNKEKEDKEDNKKKRGVGKLTDKDLKKLQYQYPTVIVKNSYEIFVNHYKAKGQEFEDELPGFVNWLIRDKESKTHYRKPIIYYENICSECGDNSSIEITDDIGFVIPCDTCGNDKKPKRLSEIETEKYIQRRKSRMSKTNKGA